MIGKIKCLLGFHDWEENKYMENAFTGFKERVCKRCLRREESCYDMTYGETYWRMI